MRARTYSIIIVPSDHSGTRQFRLSRRLLIIGTILLGVLIVAMLSFLFSYGRVLTLARHVPELRRENSALREQIVVLNELNQELEDLSVLRAQIVSLLGHGIDANALEAGPPKPVEPADPLVALQPERLDHLQAVDLVRRYAPSHWPLTGEVRREFTRGDADGANAHPGLSILPASDGEAVASAGAGRVVAVGHRDDSASFVRIEHGFAVESYYAGMSQLLVDHGQMVEAGQALGYLGAPRSGESTPLYFEVRLDGTPVDPRRYLENR
jgi:murein DD-endopeptidase MepM/ murein hydrolase activator NlpD